MRSTGILSIYICIFSSLFLFVCGIFLTLIYKDNAFLISIWSIFFYLPFFPIHALVIAILKKCAYQKEDITWFLSLSNWMIFGFLWLVIVEESLVIWFLAFLLAGCSSLGIITTFSLSDPAPSSSMEVSALYPIDNTPTQEDLMSAPLENPTRQSDIEQADLAV